MVDFRYHLVSLVSVFLALAVGIILGAGPLQNAIGDTLSNRVEALRASRDDAREKFDAANDELKSSNAALKKAGEQLVDKTLTGRRVARAREQPGPAGQPLGDLPRRQGAGAGGRQLNGQGDALQPGEEVVQIRVVDDLAGAGRQGAGAEQLGR